VEKRTLKKSGEREQLKEANKVYTECLSKEFVGRFLAGEQVSVNDFCVREREDMMRLDK